MLFCKKSDGFTLVEVLVALVVISIGLLGVAGSALFSLRESTLAYQYSIATVAAVNMQERLQVNASQAARQRELTLWNAENKKILPHGHGEFSCSTDQCDVILHWGKADSYSVTI